MDLDLGAARNWLELLHGDSDGFLHVCSSGNWEGFVTSDPGSAIAYIRTMDLRQPQGIYLRATTVKGKLPPGSRGGIKDTRCFPGLWGDIDIAGPGHKHDPAKTEGRPLVPTAEDAIKVVSSSGLPEPTLWVHSGGGLYPWWLLREPYCVEDEEELETLGILSEHWQETLAYSAKQLGFHYGTETKDLARVLRIPGTINRKVPNEPRLCHVANQLSGGGTFSLDELWAALTVNLPKIQKPERPLPARIIESGAGDLSPGDALEEVPWDDSMLLGDWELHHQRGDTCYWTRPGKSRKDGYSATTGYDPSRDRLYVFSSSTGLPTLEPLTKFAVYTELHHGGDYGAAAGALRQRGFGGRRTTEVAVPLAEPWSPPEPDQPTVTVTVTWSRFSWDDMGNAERFTFRYRDNVRWVVDTERWAMYVHNRWEEITEAQVGAMVQKLVDELPRLELDLYSDDPVVASNGKQMPTEREQFLAWIAKQRMDARLRAVPRNAAGQPELYAKSAEFDKNRMLLNCLNGVLDLRSGLLSAACPEMMLMQQATVNWDENAQCPMWLEYLNRVMPDPEMQAYLQRITGYSMTGDVSERVIFLHYGGGHNGKSVYLDVVGRILGSYAITVAAETLMTKQFQSNHNADVARMAKKRFLRTSESNLGKHLDEGQVKLLAGGDDKIVARFPYQRYPIEFYPTGKVNFATNYLPEISDSNSIWGRIRMINWDVEIPADERDRHLTDRIIAEERSGILAWAVQGCLEWQRIGLAVPPGAEMRELENRDNMSVFGTFLADCSKRTPGTKQTHADQYAAYRLWCERNGQRPMSGKSFSMAMVERGFRRWRDMSARGYMDITIRTPLQAEVDWRTQAN